MRLGNHKSNIGEDVPGGMRLFGLGGFIVSHAYVTRALQELDRAFCYKRHGHLHAIAYDQS